MHYYQLGFHILLLSVIGLLYQTHGHENDEDKTGYEGLTEQDMNEMCMDPGLIAGIMKARAEAGQGQSDSQGQQTNNLPPPSPPRRPATDDDDDEDLRRILAESAQAFQTHNNAIDDENLQRALRESEQAFQSNDNDDYQSVIEASMRELQSQEEKQIQLARTLSMGHSRNNYDNGVGSDNEDIETQQALFRSLSVQSNQSRNANMIKPKKKKKSTTTTTTKGKKKRNEEVSSSSSSTRSSSSSSTRRSSQSKPQEVKEEPSISAGSSSRSKTKKDNKGEKGSGNMK
ncbi:hypothetical protein niasHS_013683 [Heterodera schachtii]|uniref:Uncharacterized protein n=1 Tax=Heterodera schachtii TaxID=97005 RepID=A0ABD2IF59_HETSC